MKKLTDLVMKDENKDKMLKPSCPAPGITWLCREPGKKVRIHMAGLGDVGQNVAIGLTTLGGDKVSRLGLYDLNSAQCLRMQTELSQIADPFTGRVFPQITLPKAEELFDCDVFLFCATRSVPALNSGITDVRMAQYAANKPIVESYARQAAEAGYRGLFIVVSDPVDLLTLAAARAGCAASGLQPKPEQAQQASTACSMHPLQFQGCGLGVMNARAAYYARLDSRFSSYLTEGRAFGPHGKDLVIANSILPEHYDETLSEELTSLTVAANHRVRDLGFKPFIAPAYSSAVFTILAILSGEYNYSACYLNGLYFGAKNRTTPDGIEWEIKELPQPLFERLERAFRSLEETGYGETNLP